MSRVRLTTSRLCLREHNALHKPHDSTILHVDKELCRCSARQRFPGFPLESRLAADDRELVPSQIYSRRPAPALVWPGARRLSSWLWHLSPLARVWSKSPQLGSAVSFCGTELLGSSWRVRQASRHVYAWLAVCPGEQPQVLRTVCPCRPQVRRGHVGHARLPQIPRCRGTARPGSVAATRTGGLQRPVAISVLPEVAQAANAPLRLHIRLDINEQARCRVTHSDRRSRVPHPSKHPAPGLRRRRGERDRCGGGVRERGGRRRR